MNIKKGNVNWLLMNCILYIKTDSDIDNYSQQLAGYFGNVNTTGQIFNQTTLIVKPTFLSMYFYGHTNQVVNVLFAKENADTLRIFIEGVNQRSNLDQLVEGVRKIFNHLKSFFDNKKIKYRNISATIWSEEEEMLMGEYQSFPAKFKSFIPDTPTGIYLIVLTIIYSVIKPKTLDAFKDATINIILVILAVLVWLTVKATNKKTNLSFKIK